MKEESRRLAHALAECIHACNDCFNGCLEEKHVEKMKKCIRLDKECAEICGTALAMVYAGSHYKQEILTLCKNICHDCAEECKRHPEDHCQECAQMCETCAKVCGEFLNETVYEGTC